MTFQLFTRLLFIPCLAAATNAASAADSAAPIRELDKVKPMSAVFQAASQHTPLTIRSRREASQYFFRTSLTELLAQVRKTFMVRP